LPRYETNQIESAEVLRRSWAGWLPLVVLPVGAVVCRNLLSAWAFMWILASTIFSA
jgi:hypothetical protein